MDLERFPRSDSAKRMLTYVTKGWYDNSYVGKWLYEVMGIELDQVQELIDELPYQAFVETATWGLAYHEIKWGLPVKESLPYEERRRLIYRKRDERAPMTPYRMEVILNNITGREAHVDDTSGPVNTFTVTLDPGDGAVDVAGAIQRLKEIKQSHVTFTVRILAFTQIEICGKIDRYRALYPACGTVPKVSTGLELRDVGLELVPDTREFYERFPMAGASGNAGQYPKTSTGMQVTDGQVDIAADAAGNYMVFPYANEKMRSGTHPKPGSQAVCMDVGVDVSPKTSGSRFENRHAGTAPATSRGLGSHIAGAEIVPALGAIKEEFPTAGGPGRAGRYPGTSTGYTDAEGAVEAAISASGSVYHGRPSGTAPGISEGIEGAGNGVIPEVDTECYQVQYRFCGDDLGL